MRVCLWVDPFLRIINKNYATPLDVKPFPAPLYGAEFFFAFSVKLPLHMIDKAYVLFYNKITFGLFSLNFWLIFNKLYQK